MFLSSKSSTFPVLLTQCDSFYRNLAINGNSHSPPAHYDEGGAAGGGGGRGEGVTAEEAVAEIEMEAEDGPVAVDLPDIRNRSMMINDDQCNDHTNISIEHTMINDGD